MLYDDNFVISLPQDNLYEAVLKVLNLLFEREESFGITPADIIEARSLVLALSELQNITFGAEVEKLSWRTITHTDRIKSGLNSIRTICIAKHEVRKAKN